MPYWRLSVFYLFYFGSLGVLVPYWGLYLQQQGFGPQAIGELMAILMATKVVAPYLWGWIADHTGRRMAIVRLASLLSAGAFIGVFFAEGFWWLAAVILVFSFFWNASLPQFEAVTLNHLQADVHRYSHVRVWGSVGFILTVAALGWPLDRVGTNLVPWVVWALFLGIWGASLSVPEQVSAPLRSDGAPITPALSRPAVLAFLAVCFLMQAGHGPYYAFYSIYMEDHGYSRSTIGQLWALGVVAEVLVFLFMHRMLRHYGAHRVLLVSLGLAAVRWLLIGGFVDSLVVMMGAQVLHAATFGFFHAASIHLIHTYFQGRLQGRGQALYSSVSFGAGGAAGSLAAGYLWEDVGATVTYGLASLISFVAVVIAWRWIDGTGTDVKT